MKKILTILMSVGLVLLVTACSQTDEYTMSIKPSEFSEETLEVLDLIDDEMQFFDISLDETVNSYTVAVWVYRNGKWHEDGKTYGEADFDDRRIAINLTTDAYELYMIGDTGHTSYGYPTLETDFVNSIGIGSSRIDREIPLELNKETPIWVKIGTEKNSMSVSDITEDFRNNDCNAGIAITLTVSDEVIE